MGGRFPKIHERLRLGDQIQFFHPEGIEPEVDGKVEVIYQEGSVLCAYKPPVLPMHEGGPYRRNTFARFIKDVAGEQWAAVHRLDLETSGIVVCGSNLKVRQELNRMWRSGEVQKEYLAICKGRAEVASWTVDEPIGDLKTSEIRIKKWVVKGGQPAITEFEVEDEASHHTLVRAFPKTGRTNQIRIHAAYSGLILLGDKLFHTDENVFLTYYKEGRTEWVTEQTGFDRCCLHAASISFVHPESGKRVRVESPLPIDMQNAWEHLKNQYDSSE